METNDRFEFSAVPDGRTVAVAIGYVLSGRVMLLRTLGIVLLVAAGLFWLWAAFTSALLYLVLAVLAGVVTPFYLLRSSARSLLPVMAGRPTVYRIDADGVRATDPLSEFLYRWPLITSIAERPGVLILRIGPRFVPLSVTGVPAETVAAVVAFARSRIGPGVAAPS